MNRSGPVPSSGLTHRNGLVGVAVILLLALVALVLTIHDTTWLDHLDISLDHRLRPSSPVGAASATPDPVPLAPARALAIAELGDGQVIGVIATLTAVATALATRRGRVVWAPALTLGVLVGAVEGGKHLLGRAPPGTVGDQPHAFGVGGVSFPSGHSAGTLVVFGLVAALFCGPAGIRPSRRAHAWLTVAACLVSATVGTLTITVDWHWPTDVLGGWLLGGAVLIGGNVLLAGAGRPPSPGTGDGPGRTS
jgi:membrane-associated phospholipid phosphatase